MKPFTPTPSDRVKNPELKKVYVFCYISGIWFMKKTTPELYPLYTKNVEMSIFLFKISLSLSYGCFPWVGEALVSLLRATEVSPTSQVLDSGWSLSR